MGREEQSKVRDILAGRCILIAGVLRPSSLAAVIAREVIACGGRVVLTAPPMSARLTEAVAKKYGWEVPVCHWDATDAASTATLPARLKTFGVTQLDGVVHAVAHASADLLGDGLSWPGRTEDPDAAPGEIETWIGHLEHAFTVSVVSLPLLLGGVGSLLADNAAVVTLTFESERVVPGYGWMGPLKAALEASVRGLAVEYGVRGVRINALSAGPVSTPAGSAIPGFHKLAAHYEAHAPLGWDSTDPWQLSRAAVALLSPLMQVTGQVMRVDGGASVRL